MPTENALGPRIAYHRRIARMTQQELADAASIHVGTLRKIERGARGASDAVLESIAAALGVDPSHLLASRDRAEARVHAAMPALSAAIAAYDVPDAGPVRPLPELRADVEEAVTWRLASQYVRIARQMPPLIGELTRAFHLASGGARAETASLLVSALRTADAVAYKYGARDLSARLVDLMRWAAPYAQDQLLDAAVAYVRTETFFAARAHASGLRALEMAADSAPAARDDETRAVRGALHMRAAVIAGRAGRADAADHHLAEARRMGDAVSESIYQGTAFGPDSVRIHEVAVAVSLGGDHAHRAIEVAREWKPPEDLPTERRSGFYIELARAQLWSGLPRDAFESLKVARHIAPQHTRDHPWVREDAATLRRLRRADAESLSNFAEWCHAGE
ncbi:helix-turn-helix domain-containing protein [Streptomyces hygroscopicus]|uniref:helix-turn-helix domain-containing protein n=1 Tax=Streptomyces hygroscopicus TaxID=1912 RepID=UPI000783249E|nr:helix-turn-helix transcriptional regulator [Streptomyces hygroscopicus]MBW8090630.1 helix-turn-helix transcriptional regulator [Streptomyces hygroscopicus subsp. hygroscopicus]